MKYLMLAHMLVILLLGSCNNHQKDSHSHDQEVHLEPLSYTMYSDKIELFVEFNPLVAGGLSSFATHLTLLGDSFLPLKTGKVSVSLIVGEHGIRNSSDSASSPGIFKLALNPKTSGIGKLIFNIETDQFVDQFIIDSVEIYPNEQAALENQKASVHTGEIMYLKEQAWKTEFANRPLTKQAIHDIIRTSGQIRSAPGDEIVLTAIAAGTILFAKGGMLAGKEVIKGSRLFTISGGNNTQGNVNSEFMEAKADYEKAQADLMRAKELVKDKIVSEKEYLQTKLLYDNARTRYNTIAKNYSGSGQNISSPINGFVKQIFVAEGQYAELGTPLAILTKNKKIVLEASVSQTHFGKLPMITSAHFVMAGIPTVFDTRKLNGKVISYGKNTNENSPFIPIAFELDNTGSFIPGSAVEVFLKTSKIPDAFIVPVSALIEEQGNFYVFIQTGGERFQKREVKLGVHDGEHVQILSGVAEAERVVTKGAYQIKLAAVSGSLPAHSHEH